MLRRFCAWDLESLHEFKLIQVNPSQSSSQLHIRFVRPFFSKSSFLCAFSFYACSFSSFSPLFFSSNVSVLSFSSYFHFRLRPKEQLLFHFELKNVFLFWGTLMDALSGATGSTLGCKGTEALLSWAIFYRTRCGGYSRDFCEPTSCWPSVSVIWHLRASMITCIPWRYVRQDLRHAFSICFSYLLRAARPVLWSSVKYYWKKCVPGYLVVLAAQWCRGSMGAGSRLPLATRVLLLMSWCSVNVWCHAFLRKLRGSLVALWCIGVLAVKDNSSVKMLNLYFSDYLIF